LAQDLFVRQELGRALGDLERLGVHGATEAWLDGTGADNVRVLELRRPLGEHTGSGA
jgi:hypothetical protein